MGLTLASTYCVIPSRMLHFSQSQCPRLERVGVRRGCREAEVSGHTHTVLGKAPGIGEVLNLSLLDPTHAQAGVQSPEGAQYVTGTLKEQRA